MNQADLQRIEPLNGALLEAWGPGGSRAAENDALRCYLDTRSSLSESYRMFEIANHRVFRTGDGLLVPYDAHGLLIVFLLGPGGQKVIYEKKFPHGTVFTDRWLFELAGVKGEAVDLQLRIYHLDAGDMDAVQVHRLRDLASVLERINLSGSRHEVVYLLRFLVARLCTSAYRSLAGAKNLQPEIFRVRKALIAFLEGPFSGRLGLPTRVLVRHISGLVTQPRLIERVWQDTIDLCEVHVRNSSIANEIRRSTHHSLGWRTLELAQAYVQWLRTGSADFPDPEHMVPGETDEAARLRPDIIELAARISADLEHLLGGAQIMQRLEEWRQAYAADLERCETGRSFSAEMELLLQAGADSNRWTWQKHLRTLGKMVREGGWPEAAKNAITECLNGLAETLPGDPGFDLAAAGSSIEGTAEPFLAAVRARHRDALFDELDRLQPLLSENDYLAVFDHCSRVRHELEGLAGSGAFEVQRLLLFQLDCLLEEAGYYALRHVAHGYSENGLDLPQCLAIVQRCAVNLVLDGLFSRELWDLSVLLIDPDCTGRARLDVLENLQRNYHRLVRRVSEAYEVMADHLGYGEDEMRAVLGNFFRSMHDLNNLAHFADAARAHIAAASEDRTETGFTHSRRDPWYFQHLSHNEQVVRRVQSFDEPSLRDMYGGKGSGLIYLSYLGVPTRDAFIIPTDVARRGLHRSDTERLEREVADHLAILETDISRDDAKPVRLGDPAAPLLLAVRGGSVFSMPGQLETIVFVGMTWAVAEALAEEDEWFAWDAFRRFLASYAAAVWHIDLEALDLVDRTKAKFGVAQKVDLPGEAMREIVEKSRDAIANAGHGEAIDALLDDAELQLHTAVRAVCDSWSAERACRYREIKHLSDRWSTAVIVQQMAAGNHSNPPGAESDETKISLTGVIPRTHMQPTGFRSYTGDIKFGASGDDLVGGLTEAASFEPVQHLQQAAPMLERWINHINSRIRRFMGTDAEIEFTVERGVLSVLQSRSAETEHMFAPRTFKDPGEACGMGIGVMGGAFRGVAAFNEADAQRLRAELDPESEQVDGVLLVLENPVPDEIPLILSVDGLLASRGGSTAHAAVAVNGIDDKPFSAVLGVSRLKVTPDSAQILDSTGRPKCVIRPGDVVSIHGQTGEVFAGARALFS
jgi:hypothetical protein